MKITIQILYLLFSFFFTKVETGDEIVNALKQGKTSELVKYFDDRISVKLINQEDVLSKAQAEANIKYFFEKHPLKNFTSSHISSGSSTAQYITGILETGNGKFRLSILLKRGLITQFRIENDND